jgi:hypothetical protein
MRLSRGALLFFLVLMTFFVTEFFEFVGRTTE